MQRGASPSPPDRTLLAAAFTASPVATLIVDAESAAVVAVNPAFCALLGRTEADLVGRAYPLDDDAGEAAGRLRAALAQRRPACVRFARANGSAGAAVEVSVAPVTEPDGTVRHLCVTHVVRDAAESALRGALEQKTALLHELDHRVKNNLQVINSLVLLKARRTPDGPVRVALNGMADRIGALSSAQRLLYAVGDVSRFDLKDFVADFAADLAVGIEADRIAVRAEADSVSVFASKAAPLALLVHELATNAVRHAFPGDRTGEVAIAVHHEGQAARVVIEDDGVGRAADARDGFGRALVEMLVRQMRGTLDYEDRAPGTRATVTFPLNTEEAEAT